MSPSALEVSDLRKRYGETVALDGLTFTVPAGTMHGFVGPNGAGKTTAMRIVLGVLAPDGGEVRFDGRPIDTAMRRRIGYMPEERGLYPKMKVGDQITYLAALHGLDDTGAKAATARWLGKLGIADRAGDRVEALSLGNQQRVQLGAALVHDPALLVLDEPFSGLDPVGVDVLAGVLRERAAAGVPVVFSSHQLELVERLCKSVTIVRGGRVVADGTVAGLRERADRAHPRLRVSVPGSDGGWATAVPGVTVLERTGDTVVVEVPADADGTAGGAADRAVLDAALAAGPVRHFSRISTSLTELFREVVTA